MVRVVENKTFTLIESDITAVANPIDLGRIDSNQPHCFVGVQFFADALGTTPATPGAGTVTITVRAINTSPLFEVIPDNVIDATDPDTKSWAANTDRVLATPSGITVAAFYRLMVTCNGT